MNKLAVGALLTILVIYVTMVYGPIAAMLVEMFPTRIRYTSMSLPYHIGNGWFGGFLPTIAFAIVAMNGNIYYGLWYPIGVAALSFVVCLFFIQRDQGRRHLQELIASGGARRGAEPAPPPGAAGFCLTGKAVSRHNLRLGGLAQPVRATES